MIHTKSRLWWVSFASETAFLGVVIGEGETAHDIETEINRQSLNPGGEAVYLPIPTKHECLLSIEELEGVDRAPRWKLLSKAELPFAARLGDADEEERENFDNNCELIGAVVVREHQNGSVRS